MVGQVTAKSAGYVAGYVMKKMGSMPICMDRTREFTRMSLRPGLGANAMWNVASELLRYDLAQDRDVPHALRYGERDYKPLGKYLRRLLRTYVGKDAKAPPAALQELEEQLQIVRTFAWNNDRSVASVFREVNEPLAQQIEARYRARRIVL